MKNKYFICAENEVPDNSMPVEFTLNTKEYLIIKHQGIIRAFAEKCNHHGKSLKKARVSNGVIFCCKGYNFHTGKMLVPISNCKDLDVYDTEINNGAVYLVVGTDIPEPVQIVSSH